MGMNTMDASQLRIAFLAGARNLEANKEKINELNVFPVPDGDTGTNMTMTILSAVKEVNNAPEVTMASLTKAMSSGSLRGARGNSGVILSQLLRGFSREIQHLDTVDVPTLANAFSRATETAYKAVMKPKEGTILTVARSMADKAAEIALSTDDVESFLEQVIAAGEESLANTPELLPVLKEAGVVDSGGMGLMTVLKGALKGLRGEDSGEPIPDVSPITDHMGQAEPAPAGPSGHDAAAEHISTADIRFGYCTEFIINLNREGSFDGKTEKSFKDYLKSIGDSIVVVADDDIVKVHVHTNEPGNAIQRALTYGYLTNMKIDNMRVEHNERVIHGAQEMAAAQAAEDQERADGRDQDEAGEAPRERVPYALIAVSAGDGLTEIFKGIGATDVIQGGQTMNPSTEDILNAAQRANADTVYIFPNNKNIILAANQAQMIADFCKIVVVPTKTIPQGITAIINFSPDLGEEENLEAMKREITQVKSGEITYAVHDATIDGKSITKGDIMAIGDSGLLAVGHEVEDTALMAVRAMADADSELISIYSGADVEESRAEALKKLVHDEFPDCEVELNRGGQPVYYYILSVE
ncbi:DAK2 domain-containing protein [Clostridium vitabionis]|uniref:DAK2 domain-containing protein n=1 Tax=Clostridium vitabionis TaxID=2784388 RepID=UPI00188B8372|nr:DAK2 domain-containing protein [Clostridium vitabionis]